ncbi:MAG: radical SAM protein [Candidatus Bathyarchaeota archaeon]|nr:radical SAM protein [Candidatus Bathyarchaeota archaeon]
MKEVFAKTILSKSKVLDYTINPYVGCEHACTYCYARFMKRFTGHKEKWGAFVDVKINAARLLEREIRKKRAGRVWMSGVCDPYQPTERNYEITKNCLEILSEHGWPVTVQTKSPLVIRDLELLRNMNDIEIIITISTASDDVRKIFEPKSPVIRERIRTIEKLHSSGLKTCAMIAPLLPGAEGLAVELSRKVDHVLIDKMNYHYADWVYRKHGLEHAMTHRYFSQRKKELAEAFNQERIAYQFLF